MFTSVTRAIASTYIKLAASWLHHIEDDTFDDICDDNLETWWEADLRQSSDDAEPHNGYQQIAIVGVMMEDTNGSLCPGNGAQAPAHQRASAPHCSLVTGAPTAARNEFSDVYIDDLGALLDLAFFD